MTNYSVAALHRPFIACRLATSGTCDSSFPESRVAQSPSENLHIFPFLRISLINILDWPTCLSPSPPVNRIANRLSSQSEDERWRTFLRRQLLGLPLL